MTERMPGRSHFESDIQAGFYSVEVTDEDGMPAEEHSPTIQRSGDVGWPNSRQFPVGTNSKFLGKRIKKAAVIPVSCNGKLGGPSSRPRIPALALLRTNLSTDSGLESEPSSPGAQTDECPQISYSDQESVTSDAVTGVTKKQSNDKTETKSSTGDCGLVEMAEQSGSEMKHSFDKLVKHHAQQFHSMEKGSHTYRAPDFVGRHMGPTGGTLMLKNKSDGSVVCLIIDKDALHRSQPIFMAADWNPMGYSPRVRLGPPGTKFQKPVYVKIPVHKAKKSDDLVLARRTDEDSEWVKNPKTAECLFIGDGVMVEISSFSDYELVPEGCIRFCLRVYVQQSTVGDGLQVRVYLSKNMDSVGQLIDTREKGLFGFLKTETDVLLDPNGSLKIQLECSDGLETLEGHNQKEVPIQCLNQQSEYGSSFLLRFTGDNSCKFKLILRSGFYAPRPLEIPVKRLDENLSPAQKAIVCADMVQEPLLEPHLLFPTSMVEDLAELLDDNPRKVCELAEHLRMPGCNRIPRPKIQKYGGSLTRCVLHFFQCLCIQKQFDTKTALRLLREKLDWVGLEVASDLVRQHEPGHRPVPQQHAEQDSFDSKLDAWKNRVEESKMSGFDPSLASYEPVSDGKNVMSDTGVGKPFLSDNSYIYNNEIPAVVPHTRPLPNDTKSSCYTSLSPAEGAVSKTGAVSETVVAISEKKTADDATCDEAESAVSDTPTCGVTVCVTHTDDGDVTDDTTDVTDAIGNTLLRPKGQNKKGLRDKDSGYGSKVLENEQSLE